MWETLGVEPTRDLAVIKKAYARQLKLYRPDTHPEQYQTLREAFEQAKRYAKSGLASVMPIADDFGGTARSSAAAPSERIKAHVDPIAVGDAEERGESRLPDPPATAKAPPREAVEQPPEDDQRYYAAAASRVFEIVTALGQDDDTSAMQRFDAALTQDASQNLVTRRYFEALCMEIAVMWPRLDYPLEIPSDKLYPIALIEHMAGYFGWADGENGSDYVKHRIPLCFARLDSATRWLTLLELAGKTKRRKPKLVSAEDIQLAKLLTGELNPRRLRMLRFLRRDIAATVRGFLQRLSEANPAAFDYEFDTATIRWWLNSPEQFGLSPASILIAVIIATVTTGVLLEGISDWLLSASDGRPGDFVLLGLLGAFFAACLALFWGSLYLFYRLRRYLASVMAPVLSWFSEFNHGSSAHIRVFLSTPPMSTVFPAIMVAAFGLPLLWPHPGVWIPIGLACLLYLLRYGTGMWLNILVTLFLSMIAWGVAIELQRASTELTEGWLALSGVLYTAYLSTAVVGMSAKFIQKQRNAKAGNPLSIRVLLLLVCVIPTASLLAWLADIGLV